jgi:hypothetical protein
MKWNKKLLIDFLQEPLDYNKRHIKENGRHCVSISNEMLESIIEYLKEEL